MATISEKQLQVSEFFTEVSEVLKRELVTGIEAPQEKEVVTVTGNDSVRELIRVLNRDHIHAVPVRNADVDANDPKLDVSEQYLGLIDVMDIVNFALDLCDSDADFKRGFLAPFVSWIERADAFARATVKDLLDAQQSLQRDVRYFVISQQATILEAFNMLSQSELGVKRLLVLDKETPPCKLVSIITQSGAMKMFSETLHVLEGVSVTEAGLGKPKDVKTVTLEQNASEAFRLMHKHNISAVPVVDKAGSLIGNVSANDVRFLVLQKGNFHKLFGTVEEFTKEIQQQNEESSQAGFVRPSGPVFCLRSDSLISVVEKMQKFHIHRVYVVESEENCKPVSVISLQDIIGLVPAKSEA